MSYLVKKNKLKPNRFYRKVKLDIDEVVDKFEAQENFGINKDIYGDDEGYFLVAEKGEDNYIVRFLTLEQLLINGVLENEGNRIDEFFTDMSNIKKLPKQEVDLDELDDAYVRLDFVNIKDELIQQFKTNGKKGIKLDKEYLDTYAKFIPFGSSKKTPITLNDTPQIDFIGEYETPLPDNTFNRIDGVEQLKENIKKWFEKEVSEGTFKLYGSKIKAPMSSNIITPTTYIFNWGTRYGNNYWDTFKNTGIQENGQIFIQAFRIFYNNRYRVNTAKPNITLYYNPFNIITDFYDIIKDTDRFKKIEVKLLKYFNNNIKTMEEYYSNKHINLWDYDFKSRSEIMKVVNSIIKSNVSQEEFSAFTFHYYENILEQEEANEKLPTKRENDNFFIFIPKEEKNRLIEEQTERIKTELRDLKKREEDEPYFEIKDKIMEEQIDKYYASANGKKYLKDNNLKLVSSKPKKTELEVPEELKNFDPSTISQEQLQMLENVLK